MQILEEINKKWSSLDALILRIFLILRKYVMMQQNSKNILRIRWFQEERMLVNTIPVQAQGCFPTAVLNYVASVRTNMHLQWSSVFKPSAVTSILIEFCSPKIYLIGGSFLQQHIGSCKDLIKGLFGTFTTWSYTGSGMITAAYPCLPPMLFHDWFFAQKINTMCIYYKYIHYF